MSDMIYSTKEMSVVNPEKIFNEIKGMTHAVFNNIVKTKSMLILKMQGSYNGPYYTYNSPNKGIAYQGERPYYIVIVGDNALLARISRIRIIVRLEISLVYQGFKSNIYLKRQAFIVLITHSC